MRLIARAMNTNLHTNPSPQLQPAGPPCNTWRARRAEAGHPEPTPVDPYAQAPTCAIAKPGPAQGDWGRGITSAPHLRRSEAEATTRWLVGRQSGSGYRPPQASASHSIVSSTAASMRPRFPRNPGRRRCVACARFRERSGVPSLIAGSGHWSDCGLDRRRCSAY